jgi:hypothetical protein
MLDILPAGDPRAERCRRDLRWINRLLGNHRWILRTLAAHGDLVGDGVVELGAGDGSLLSRIRRFNPTTPLTGLDLAPRPPALDPSIQWHTGDAIKLPGGWPGTVIVANLFLHHLEREPIEALGRRLDGIRLLLVGEAHRSPRVLRRSAWLNPFLGEITRHDMEISLAAGFVPGELPAWLGLDPHHWELIERITWLGAYRLLAIRRT